jgi:alanyl-tRNA synthetase
MALFGEKYGNSVRVVEIRDFNEAPVSIELCVGCHVPNTGQIGLFKIKHEASAASGIRRIEAVSGEAAIAYVNDQIATLRQASTLLKSNPHDLVAAVERTLDHLKEEKKKREKLAQSTGGSGDVQSQMFGEIELVIQQVTDLDPKEAQMVADRLTENHLKRISLVVAKGEGKVTFICKIGRDAVSAGAHAGNIVKHLASQTGGGGGGRPDFATAGGRQLDQVPAAIAGLTEVVGAMIKN